VVLAFVHGCAKEYSREAIDNTIPPVIDTTPPQQTPLPDTSLLFCAACAGMDKFEENQWSFKAGNSFYCGPMDTALLAPERNAFTFFGPSACSSDTSMVVTLFMENYVLNKDLQNIVIPNVDFRFTKFGAAKYLLVSQPGTPFSLTIDSYNHQTKMTIGTFSGYAYQPDGSKLLVTSGKFKARLF
jgi:hypothetical protein